MAEWTLKYADARGAIHQQVAEASSEKELRDRFSQQGFLIYSIKPRIEGRGVVRWPTALPIPNFQNTSTVSVRRSATARCSLTLSPSRAFSRQFTSPACWPV